MKNWLIFSVILLFVSVPFSVFAVSSDDDLEASDFGDADANGVFEYYGDSNGQPAFVNSADWYIYYYGTDSGQYGWYLSDDITDTGGSVKYAHWCLGENTPLSTCTNPSDWYFIAGTEPAGTLFLYEAPPVEEGESSTTATTTTDMTATNIGLGFFLFLYTLFSTLTYFKNA